MFTQLQLSAIADQHLQRSRIRSAQQRVIRDTVRQLDLSRVSDLIDVWEQLPSEPGAAITHMVRDLGIVDRFRQTADILEVQITGSREIQHRSTVAQPITQLWREHGKPRLLIRHGGARGADRIAGQIAKQNRHRAVEEVHYADWRPHHLGGRVDRRAGIARNTRMMELGADICLAFFKYGAENRGTTHGAETAEAFGIPTIRIWELNTEESR